ncbi:MAG: MobA/MobL family protein [Lachnospiraceae bacterium]|nr:MobA/MobL family protein [Lachnospiraceae bacterium]
MHESTNWRSLHIVYTKRKGVLYTEILLPGHAPERLRNRETLWNEVEKNEKHPKAQLCYSFDIALQTELTPEENITLAKTFVQDELVSRGMICDLSVHEPDEKDGIRNPHFHVLYPIRPLRPDGSWGDKQQRVYLTDEKGEPVVDKKGKPRFNAVPTTDWGSKNTLSEWRKNWADLVNRKFEEKGLACRIDHRSNAARGMEELPHIHEGSASVKLTAKGLPSRKAEHNRMISYVNRILKGILLGFQVIHTVIREIREEMKKLPEPQLGDLLTDYFRYRHQAAHGFIPDSPKTSLMSLQQMADIYNYLVTKDIMSVDSLMERLNTVDQKILLRKNLIDSKNVEASFYREMAQKGKALFETKAVHEEYQKIHFSSARKRFMEAHGKELRKYYAARRFFEERNLEPAPDLIRTWKAKAEELEKEISSLYEGLKPLSAERYNLEGIRKITEFSLNRRKGIKPDHIPIVRIVDEKPPAFAKNSVLDRLAGKQEEVRKNAPGRPEKNRTGRRR